MKMRKHNILHTLYLLIATAILTGVATSCEDDTFNSYYDGSSDGVNLSIDFMPAAESEVQSRALWPMPGEGMSGTGAIDDMCIVVFDTDGNFVQLQEVTDYRDEELNRTDDSASNGNLAGETKTTRRHVNLDLTTGEYYIYAVANLVTYEEVNKEVKLTRSTAQNLRAADIESMSRDEFRAMRRVWDPGNYLNNREMSGIVTQTELPGTTAFTGREESTVRIYPGVNLHCWLRRLASKVTVTFDANQLNPSTTVYIREIRVRDIPYDCSLVEGNTVKADGNSVATDQPFGLLDNSRDNHAIQTCKEADRTGKPELTHKNWLALKAGIPTIQDFIKQSTDAALNKQLDNINHSNAGKCIFFYENMQGPGESKRQDADGPDGAGDGHIDSPGSWEPGTDHYKDNKPGGTYVEVIGYYESYDKGNEGSGEIIYRFMLGKNAEDNYDAERNHHYKLTMVFRGYANDVDWHIEYDQSEPPVTLPKEYYISYGYNEMTEYPVKISGELVDDMITVEIVRNDWFPSNTWEDSRPAPGIGAHPFHSVFVDPKDATRANATKDPDNLSVGFLSLRKTHADAAGAHVAKYSTDIYSNAKKLSYLYDLWMGQTSATFGDGEDYVRNKNTNLAIYNDKKFVPTEYIGKRPLGFRCYKVDGLTSGDKVYSVAGTEDENSDGTFRAWTKPGSSSKVPRQTTVYIPLYTRNRNLVKTSGYTGENPYNVFQRRAAIRLKFTVKNNSGTHKIDTVIPIIQATKLANPMGIWRAWNNAAPFEVHLKYLNGRQATTYTALTSKAGGWSAEVEKGADWILLNGGKRKIYGGEGSEIKFTYRPAGILSNPKQVRCGIITVRYHNYSCIHKIFVRQGYAPIKIHTGHAAWHTFNLVTKDSEASSPTDEGSLFKHSNLDDPIDAINNKNDQKPWTDVTPSMFKDHTTDDLKLATGGTKTWAKITSKNENTDFPTSLTLKNGTKARLPKVEDVKELRDEPETGYQFGVLYGDYATSTGDNTDEAYRYKEDEPESHSYGMRGCFIYNKTTGNQIFLPIGASGYGVRKEGRGKDPVKPEDLPSEHNWKNASTTEVGRAIVRYSTGRSTYMNSARNDLPLLYDIFRSRGAIYWLEKYATGDPNHLNKDGKEIPRSSIDFNYSTFDFNTLGNEPFLGYGKGPNEGNVKNPSDYGSDACFIRLVE